nr:bi-domain-containing oxidoreductase [Oharaeibacter diazotrophicus]
MQLAKSSLVAKAAARPDLVRRVIRTARREGVMETARKVLARLDTPIPLGYSLVGEVVAVGRRVEGLAPGDRVACAGAGLANHAEYNCVPKNLVVRVPDRVADEDASFVTLGAIALQGVRLAVPTLGEWVVVMGLGLIGLVTVQILKAAGCRVIGLDPNAARAALARDLGADVAVTDGLERAVAAATGGFGADAVIVTASTPSSAPVNLAAEVSRLKGRIVVVGMVGLSIDREPFYRRELELKLSMSYGPGRGDPAYEAGGHDYPQAYVRWTEQRNMAAFLGLVEEGRVTPAALVTHRFPIAGAEAAYALLDGDEPYLAILITYPDAGAAAPIRRDLALRPKPAGERLAVAFVGLGNYARSVLLPKVKADPGVDLAAVVTRTGLAAGHAAAGLGFRHAATDAEAAFGADIDVVFVATRHDSHADLAARALAAGKHVFCEKPLALDHAGLDRVAAAAAATPALLAIGFNRRFAPLMAEVKASLSGRPGPKVMLYRVNAGKLPADSWIGREEGGGRVLGEVCHFVDTLTFLAGSLPVEVQAVAATGVRDAVSVLLRFADGSTGTIVYSPVGDASAPKEYLEVMADGVVARLDDFTRLTLHVDGRTRTVKGRQDKGQAGLVAAFLKAVRTGGPAPIPFDEIEAVSRATIAIEEALRHG